MREGPQISPLLVLGWDLRLPLRIRDKGVRVQGWGLNWVLTGALPERASALGLVRTGAQKRALLDMEGKGNKRGKDPESPTDEPCPQGAPELRHAHRKQGRWDPGRDGRKVLLNGGQLQVRCSRAHGDLRTRCF